MGEAMADQDIFHTAELVRAAIPFVDNRTQGMADLFVKVCDLMGSVKSAKKPQNLAACGFALENIDVEGLLAAVRPVCNKRERDIVDRILNLFHMKKMFEMYTNMMEAMKTMQDVGGFPFGDMNQDDTSNIFSNFSGTNFDSIFQTIKAFTSQGTNDTEDSSASNQSYSDDHSNADTKDVYAAEMTEDHNFETNNDFRTDSSAKYDSNTSYGSDPDFGYSNAADTNQNPGADTSYRFQSEVAQDKTNDVSDDKPAAGEETNPQMDQTVADILRDIKAAAAADSFSSSNKSTGSSSGSGSASSSGSTSGSSSASGSSSTSGSAKASGSGSSPTPMLDMLKSMVPSDKMSSFENLSMLFNSMSYDNNSKTDDQKGE
jgi:hypothetical protein